MISIAIDGPAGAGKSSVAKALAKELGYMYLDTGALYRAVGLAALEQNVPVEDEQAVSALLPSLSLRLTYDEGGAQHVFLNDRDVSLDIRRPEMSMAASVVSAFACVRAHLLDVQRSAAMRHNIIMDGRDIGTVILPQATLKIFLTAKPEERARRRMLDLQSAGHTVDFSTLLAEIHRRDYNDIHRATAPLQAAADAVLVDSTELTFTETVQQVRNLLAEKMQHG